MKSWITFAGSSTRDIQGLYIEGKDIYGLPERSVEKIEVPGRNGDVLIDHGSYKNITITYRCAATNRDALLGLARMLFSPDMRGYQLLTDSYSTTERMAVCANAIPVEEVIVNRLLRVPIVFDCKPQKYYNRTNTISGGAGVISLSRPAGALQAECLIEVVATGQTVLTVNGIQIASVLLERHQTMPSLLCDSESKVCYTTSASGVRMKLNLQDWPVLKGSSNTISVTGASVTSVKIQPRWWGL